MNQIEWKLICLQKARIRCGSWIEDNTSYLAWLLLNKIFLYSGQKPWRKIKNRDLKCEMKGKKWTTTTMESLINTCTKTVTDRLWKATFISFEYSRIAALIFHLKTKEKQRFCDNPWTSLSHSLITPFKFLIKMPL